VPVPTVAEDQTRQGNEDESDKGSDATEDDELECPRGASRTADVGTTPGISGSSPAVFTQCAKDFKG
jgi:hypothetical protein